MFGAVDEPLASWMLVHGQVYSFEWQFACKFEVEVVSKIFIYNPKIFHQFLPQ